MASVLVFAEHTDGQFPRTTLSAIRAGMDLAASLGVPCIALVLGRSGASAEAISDFGVSKVISAWHEALEPACVDLYARVIADVAASESSRYVLGAATTVGKDVLPRVAARLSAPMASEVVAFDADGSIRRFMYAGNALATVTLDGDVRVASIRPTAFEPAARVAGQSPVDLLHVPLGDAASKLRLVERATASSGRVSLRDARVIVAGGRGLRSAENFEKILAPLAEALDGAVGASRAAVDSGFAPNSLQIGQTGKIVAPQLYIAVGLSGAIQHLAGMKDSKVIVAINTDKDAPIFQIADYGLVGDLFEVVPELTESVRRASSL